MDEVIHPYAITQRVIHQFTASICVVTTTSTGGNSNSPTH